MHLRGTDLNPDVGLQCPTKAEAILDPNARVSVPQPWVQKVEVLISSL
jgi:hypothetical protein